MIDRSVFVRTLLASGLALAPAAPLVAQDGSNTILVLDGSGSMWGQIAGINKIVIAREVVGDQLDGFPEDQNLGLTVYGHRERGNCADIETVVAPGAGTLGAIRDAVNGINPRGKTPMTDAVIAAAEALRYTEEKATVILVSDGIETCNPDPCAAAAALEQAGIDFTAHVVGFDVTDPEALAQMQCIADGTGGQFLSASNAAELTDALTTVAVAPEPEPPATVDVTFEARLDAEDGPLVDGPVLWSLSPLPENVAAEEEGNGLTFSMDEGSYDLTAYWLAGETEVTRQFIATPDRTVVVVFESPPVTATITAPAEAVAGSTIEVGWNGPEKADDYIGIGAEGATGAQPWRNYVYVEGGAPANLLVPPDPGPHMITYFDGETREPLGAVPILVTPVEVTLTAPAEAAISSFIEVGWTGPAYEDDYIGVGRVDATGAQPWENYTYVSEGSPLLLQVPATEGEYLIQYFMSQDRTPIASVPLKVVQPEVSVTAPATAEGGTMIEVTWVGPDTPNDYIGIGAVGASGAQKWRNYTYTNTGNPVMLEMPPETGTYEITYFLDQDRTALATTTIEITAPETSVTAPATAVGGSTIEVAWSGPNADDDYIGIGIEGASGAQLWRNYAYTRDGDPAQILVPPESGTYVISYFLAQDRTVMTSTTIEVTAPEVSLTVPPTAIGGSTIEVGWSGPDFKDDYIGIGRSDASGAQLWKRYRYTRDGAPAQLQIPVEGGTYTVRYFMGQDRTTMTEATIEVSTPDASLTAPASAAAGSTLEVGWTGPAYEDDYIGIGPAGATGGAQWRAYAYTNAGAPAQITLPEEAGDYVIRYFAGPDRVVLAEASLTIE